MSRFLGRVSLGAVLFLAACGGIAEGPGDPSPVPSPAPSPSPSPAPSPVPSPVPSPAPSPVPSPVPGSLGFPIGVETACSATVMQLSAHLQATTGLQQPGEPATVTVTSSNGVLTATVSGTFDPIAPVAFIATSNTSASVQAGQTLTVPTETLTAADPSSPATSTALPVSGGSMTLDGDSFFMSLELPLQGTDGPAAIAVTLACTAGAPSWTTTGCACPAGDLSCTCNGAAAATLPLGVYTQCSTDLEQVGPSGLCGGDTTVTLANDDGNLTVTVGGSQPIVTGTLGLTSTNAAVAAIPGGQSFGAAQASATLSCTPEPDAPMQSAWPLSVTSGTVTTDGQWLTFSLVGTSPCSTEERLAIVCAAQSN